MSVLSSLEPIFGAALAINLAYLNLNQFRYRDHMASVAAGKLQAAPATVHSKAWYLEIKSLANQKNDEKAKLKLPARSLWGLIYRFLFHWQLDRMISVFMTILSAMYLYLGVAHEVGLHSSTYWAFTEGEIRNELNYASFGLAWPMIMVLCAKYCTASCTAFVKYQLDDIAKSELETGSEDIKTATAGIDAKAGERAN